MNLHPVQHKKSKQPGDNRAMILARKYFLEAGHYDVLIDPVVSLINKLTTHKKEDVRFFDIGCGDGYFTKAIFDKTNPSTIKYGMDISKEAVKVSAKRDRGYHWLVASSSNIPLPDHSIDCILKINSPLDYANTCKKLTESGVVVSITPGERHLLALKSNIYNAPQLHTPESRPDNYKLLDVVNLQDTITLKSQVEIEQLFMMTPFYWNASQVAKEKVAKLTELTTDIAFDVHIWQKINKE